jgi:hypothetical protein
LFPPPAAMLGALQGPQRRHPCRRSESPQDSMLCSDFGAQDAR